MGETASLAEFCRRHDGETLGKLDCTGTAVYRGKLFMDVGCGGGGYADFVRGVARQVVLVEPNASFASQLREAGHEVFAYPEDALGKYCGKIELLASFDVIEHVAVPQGFLNAIHSLLAPGGQAFVGTPTDYPVLRGLLGGAFDSFVFSVQHPWVFSSESLELMAGKCGFSRFEAKPRQRFGLGNLVAWLLEREPRGEAAYDFITPALDACYKSEMAKHGTAEYLVLELVK
jgi:SAM-dependent methyltransferase